MLAAMVSSARMEVPVMNQYLLTEPYRHKSVWSLALDSEDRAWDRLRASDIEDLYKRVFRPDNITVAAGGALRPGVAQAAWDDASKNWRRQVARPLRQAVPFKEYPQPYPSHVLELHGPEIMPSDPGLASKILALVALGGGKSSSLFRVVRGDLALSYRQEAALWPTKDGLVPRVLVQIRPRAVEQEAVELNDIRVALLADIAAWDSSVLERAQGFAGAMSTNGMELGPLYFRPSAPLGPSIEDRTLLVAYWQMKTGAPWNGLAMADAFRSVDLGTLKAEAAGLVEVAIPVLHPREG
jgi:hypothetical protein